MAKKRKLIGISQEDDDLLMNEVKKALLIRYPELGGQYFSRRFIIHKLIQWALE